MTDSNAGRAAAGADSLAACGCGAVAGDAGSWPARAGAALLLAGGVAHETRNPLGIISMCAQLIELRPDDAALREQCLSKIISATQRAAAVLDALSGLARGDKSSATTNDPAAVIAEVVRLLVHGATRERVRLATDLQGELPRLQFPPVVLRIVLANMIAAALGGAQPGAECVVSAAPNAEGEVEISATVTGGADRREAIGRALGEEQSLAELFDDPVLLSLRGAEGLLRQRGGRMRLGGCGAGAMRLEAVVPAAPD